MLISKRRLMQLMPIMKKVADNSAILAKAKAEAKKKSSMRKILKNKRRKKKKIADEEQRRTDKQIDSSGMEN